ncbi:MULTISPECIES: DUF3426 domain-containing protein [unclassified Psychrobacter]|uniref:DUF3426 domain-containing protein n=1 Tax=unclassified Psychrobacter TaxID=196806 RepID=UPI0025B3F552|nr:MULTISPECIES: DUF3426 domain-containing protein [unclassified Psychrobacter]MDN3453695.1 DUF3426 domain-containing protein [Psychrobacter sp. APC 3350]MDN3501135.1 DUF3426 domain-containing protein [Psychrobacter sp. 5A.1]
MTTPIKTQCPHCQTCFKVQQTQLNKVNATICCDQCQQSFLVNKHLIVNFDIPHKPTSQIDITHQEEGRSELDSNDSLASPSNTHHKSHGISSTSRSSLHKTRSSGTLIHDDLIYDDMDVDEPEENALEYDSLDSMDAWLTQASNANAAIAIIDKPQDTHSKKTNSSTQDVLSSAAANDIHANIDSTDDNSWLEKLLEEQNKYEETPPDDTNLSQLLLDMGVPIQDEGISAEERARKTQLQFTPTPTTRSIASLLWMLGCLVLALLLAAQYVIFNLETLIKNPSYAQRLQAICAVAACSLPSADLAALTITKPHHKSSRIKAGGTFSDISATLGNGSTQAQIYPNIKVSVYGANDLIGEFIAAPNDYLLGKQGHLAANMDRTLLLTIPVANAQIREITMTALY